MRIKPTIESDQGSGVRLDGLKAIPYPWVVVALVVVAKMAGMAPSYGLPMLYPFIQEDLDLSRAKLGLISSALGAGGVATAFIGGWLVDAGGVRRVMPLALVLAGSLLILLPLGPSLPVIIALALLVGMAITPEALAGIRAILDWVPWRTRALAMSVRVAGGPLGGAIVAGILPPVAVAAGWSAGAMVLGALIILIGIVFLALYREMPRERSPMPLMSLAIVRIFSQDIRLVFTTLWSAVFFGLASIFPIYFILFSTEVLEVSAVVAGGYIGTAYIASVVARVLWGAVSDFLFSSRRILVMVILGMLCTAGLVGLSLLGPGTPGVVLVVLAVFLGVTVLSWGGMFTVAVVEMVGSANAGVTLGAMQTLMRILGIPMPALFGLLVDRTDSYSVAWGVTAAMAFGVTLVLGVFVKEQKSPTQAQPES